MIAFYLQVVEFILASHWLWTFFAIHVWLMFRLDTFKIAPEYSYVDVEDSKKDHILAIVAKRIKANQQAGTEFSITKEMKDTYDTLISRGMELERALSLVSLMPEYALLGMGQIATTEYLLPYAKDIVSAAESAKNPMNLIKYLDINIEPETKTDLSSILGINNKKLFLEIDLDFILLIIAANVIRIVASFTTGSSALFQLGVIFLVYHLVRIYKLIDFSKLAGSGLRTYVGFNAIFCLLLVFRIFGDYRIGAECCDTWLSDSTGSGTCSGHGGVYTWSVNPVYFADGFQSSRDLFQVIYLFDGEYSSRTLNSCVPDDIGLDDVFIRGRP